VKYFCFFEAMVATEDHGSICQEQGRLRRLWAMMVLMFLLAGCATYRDSPAYERCVDTCLLEHNQCMLLATDESQIRACKSNLGQCLNICDNPSPMLTPGAADGN